MHYRVVCVLILAKSGWQSHTIMLIGFFYLSLSKSE